MPTIFQSDRAPALVRIGEDAIVREDPTVLRAYFAIVTYWEGRR